MIRAKESTAGFELWQQLLCWRTAIRSLNAAGLRRFQYQKIRRTEGGGKNWLAQRAPSLNFSPNGVDPKFGVLSDL
jgi:hypothetical protein